MDRRQRILAIEYITVSRDMIYSPQAIIARSLITTSRTSRSRLGTIRM